MTERRTFPVVIYTILILGSFLMLLPLSWMLLTSLKTFSEVVADPPQWLPALPQWQNYITVLKEFKFANYLLNSVFVTTMVVTGTVVSCCCAAYGLAFLNVPYKNVVFGALLGTMMLPGQVTVIPMFKFFAAIGWVNTYYPMIVPAWLGCNVFGIFLLRQFFLTIPFSYIEAARMDGASEMAILWRLIVPMSMPVVMTVVVFTFLGSWNDLFSPLIYLHDERMYTLPIGLLTFISQAQAAGRSSGGIPLHLVMALATIMVAPIVIVFFIAQKHFIEGIASAGVKG